MFPEQFLAASSRVMKTLERVSYSKEESCFRPSCPSSSSSAAEVSDLCTPVIRSVHTLKGYVQCVLVSFLLLRQIPYQQTAQGWKRLFVLQFQITVHRSGRSQGRTQIVLSQALSGARGKHILACMFALSLLFSCTVEDALVG